MSKRWTGYGAWHLATLVGLGSSMLMGCSGPESDTGAIAQVRQQLSGTLAEDVASNNKRLLGYYTQWSIYGGHGNYYPCDVPFDRYTHINYAFVGVRPTANPAFNAGSADDYTASTKSTDYNNGFKWLKTLDYHADEGHTFCTGFDSTSITYEGEYAGNIGLLKLARESRPWLKLAVSLGGWTKGAGFPIVANDSTRRNEFCDDIVRLLRRWEFDIVDFDWEYPGVPRAADPGDEFDEGNPYAGPNDTANFTELLRVCRSKLNAAGTADGKYYGMTAAVGAAKDKLDKIDWATIRDEGLLDMVNIMTYDFHGAFDPMTGHQSSLYANPNDAFSSPINTEFNTNFTFQYLTGTKSFPASKVSVGMAFYTRGWNNVSGGIDVNGDGLLDGLFGPGGSSLSGDWGPGGQNGLNKIHDLKQQGGWEEIWDDHAKAHFLYNRSQGILYTYDSIRAVEEKTNYCLTNSCGGMFNWEIDGDVFIGSENYPLITKAAEVLAGGASCTPGTCGSLCGSVSDGCGGTLNCGGCSSGYTCNASNQCVASCTPTTCVAEGKQCGTISDGCGGTLNCGSCSAGYSCNASNQCVGSTQSPFGGSPAAIPGLIEAENYDNGGPSVAYSDSSGGNEGCSQGVTFRCDETVDIEATSDIGNGHNVGYITAGEWLEYTVDVQATGIYDIDVRVASELSGKQFRLEMNSTDITGALTVPNTGGWQNWTTVTKAGVSLTAGQQVLRLYAISDDFNVNWIRFTAISGEGQTPFLGSPHAAPGRIQAEDFDLGGQSVAYYDVTSTNEGGQYRPGEHVGIEATSDTGGGYNVGWIVSNEWLEYTVHVSATNTYDLNVRVASPNAGRSFHLEVDGANVTGTLTVPNTGDWQNWTTITKTNVSLSAGVHIVRVVIENGDFNINWFEFVQQSTCTPATCGSIGAQCGAPSDGCGGALSCGGCGSGQTCSSSFQCVSSCTPTTCAAQGATCGSINDGCGGTLNCGTCSSPQTCGGGGTPNVCGGSSGCSGVAAWDPQQHWFDYTTGDQRQHNNKKWECHTPGWCYLEPGSANGSLGWSDLGGC